MSQTCVVLAEGHTPYQMRYDVISLRIYTRVTVLRLAFGEDVRWYNFIF